MELFEAIHTLRAIRRLKPDPIPDDVLRQILEAAIRAPSGGNRQPWFFIAVRDADKRKTIGDIYGVRAIKNSSTFPITAMLQPARAPRPNSA